MKRVRFFLVALFTGLALFSGAGAADATPNFPGAIQSRLAATAAPQCSICHVCGATGRGTVNTAWGTAMRARGLQAYDESSLATALAAIESDKVDSDGDGLIDVEAVKTGQDPSPQNCDDGADDPTVPSYGCVGQISPSRGRAELGLVGLALVLGLVCLRRRRGVDQGTALLGLVVFGAALTACASGASLAPRLEAQEQATRTPPRMPPIAPSKLGADLTRLGLDPKNLPRFAALEPRQLRGVMSTFSRSLGVPCTDCHDARDPRASTPMKRVAIKMWDEMVRGHQLADGGAVYCDSCHQGQAQMLKRTDHETVAVWMSENFLERLRPIASKDEIVCETCHGDPVDPHFLAKWRRAP